MLKHELEQLIQSLALAAAFGRLCVETVYCKSGTSNGGAAAFGRLCVETLVDKSSQSLFAEQPPSGGCVLKPFEDNQQVN